MCLALSSCFKSSQTFFPSSPFFFLITLQGLPPSFRVKPCLKKILFYRSCLTKHLLPFHTFTIYRLILRALQLMVVILRIRINRIHDVWYFYMIDGSLKFLLCFVSFLLSSVWASESQKFSTSGFWHIKTIWKFRLKEKMFRTTWFGYFWK